MRTRSSLLWLATLALALAQPCLADPVAITGGSAGLYWDGQLSSFTFTGPQTTISQDSRNTWGPTSFNADTAVQFTGSLSPESTHGFDMTVNGTAYSNVVLVGSASFMTDSFMAAAGLPSVQVEVPLLLAGHFDGFTFGDIGSTPLFSFDVNLPGVFRAGFDNIGGDLFLNRSFAASAVFAAPPTPSQTPEPASLLLLGTPVGAFVLRRVQRRVRGRK